jgi:uncharacterized circularly permuted ATP-grasp superfamily protein
MLTADGGPRPGCGDVLERLQALGHELFERQRAGEAAIRSMGITFSLAGPTDSSEPDDVAPGLGLGSGLGSGSGQGDLDRSWPVDLIPRIISRQEWAEVSAGLVQRLRVLNHFIDDLYHDRQAIGDGIIPAELIEESPNYLPYCRGMRVPAGTWANICGTDLVRDGTGRFMVLEDNLRIPSGVSYMLENRQVSKRVFADLFRDLDILPVDGYLDRLAGCLKSLSPRTVGEPIVVVLTPGIFNSAYYEHAYLAARIGAHLVEGSDLRVDDGVVSMRTVSGPVRVDVIYRRVEDTYLDPEVFRPDSVLGVPGLMEAWRRGNVAIANAPGAGVADDKVVYSYIPDLTEYYLGEKPVLANVDTWRLGDPEHRAHVFDDLARWVCKPANGAGGKGVTISSRATEAELVTLRADIEADPRNWIAQPILGLSTAPTIADDRVVPRHVDLRPFILSGADPYVTAGGLTRVALREGSLIVNSSQGGGSKDTWIVDDTPAPLLDPPADFQEARR